MPDDAFGDVQVSLDADHRHLLAAAGYTGRVGRVAGPLVMAVIFAAGARLFEASWLMTGFVAASGAIGAYSYMIERNVKARALANQAARRPAERRLG